MKTFARSEALGSNEHSSPVQRRLWLLLSWQLGPGGNIASSLVLE